MTVRCIRYQAVLDKFEESKVIDLRREAAFGDFLLMTEGDSPLHPLYCPVQK